MEQSGLNGIHTGLGSRGFRSCANNTYISQAQGAGSKVRPDATEKIGPNRNIKKAHEVEQEEVASSISGGERSAFGLRFKWFTSFRLYYSTTVYRLISAVFDSLHLYPRLLHAKSGVADKRTVGITYIIRGRIIFIIL